MRLTLLFRSSSARFALNVNRRKLMVLLLAICGFVLVSSRSTTSPDENIDRIQYAKAGLEQQSEEVEMLKDATEQRLTGMLLKLADMQSQIQRLDALGSRLVEQAKLSPDEFSFNQKPSVGGPLSESVVDLEVNDQLLVKMENMLSQIQQKSVQLNALENSVELDLKLFIILILSNEYYTQEETLISSYELDYIKHKILNNFKGDLQFKFAIEIANYIKDPGEGLNFFNAFKKASINKNDEYNLLIEIQELKLMELDIPVNKKHINNKSYNLVKNINTYNKASIRFKILDFRLSFLAHTLENDEKAI